MDEEFILPTSGPYHPEPSLLILVAQIYLTSLGHTVKTTRIFNES
jgi:hypothetical protein